MNKIKAVVDSMVEGIHTQHEEKEYKFTIKNKTYTFKASSVSDALMQANKKLVWSSDIEDFYGWNDEGTPGHYHAMYGVWD